MSDQYVYFIQADENGPIKIGYTADDPKKRLSQLQTGNASTLNLLGAIKGTSAKEKELHSVLAEWRMQGEWFESHPTVISTIQDALSAASHTCGGVHCSFCGKCQRDTHSIIAGPDEVFICAECVGVCAEIVTQNLMKTVTNFACAPFPEMGYGG